MAAIVGREAGNELRAPLRSERVLAIELHQAREACGDGPKLSVGVVAKIVDTNVAGGVTAARHVTRVDAAFGVNRGSGSLLVPEFPHGCLRAQRQLRALHGNTHRAWEVAKVRVDLVAVATNENKTTALVGGNCERTIRGFENAGKRASEHT